MHSRSLGKYFLALEQPSLISLQSSSNNDFLDLSQQREARLESGRLIQCGISLAKWMLLVLHPGINYTKTFLHFVDLFLNMCQLFALILQLDCDIQDDLNRIECLRECQSRPLRSLLATQLYRVRSSAIKWKSEFW